MIEIELLPDQLRTLELRVVALEQAARILQGHAPDEVVATDFGGLWAALVHLYPPDQWGELRRLYRTIIEQRAPDVMDHARDWLNSRFDELGGTRPIDLIKQGEIRQAQDALMGGVRSEIAS